MSTKGLGLETLVVRGGEPDPKLEGAVVAPIFQSATFLYSGQERYEDLKYIRLNNTPNHSLLHRKLSLLENGEDALVTSSGMSAISAVLLSLLSSGNHLLAQDCLYGGTRDLLTKDLPSLGIDFDFIDASDPGSWEAKLRPDTKAIYVEAITNPLMEIGELSEVVSFAKKQGLISVIDNTFATPVNFRPLDLGFDLVVHSCTKYLNGHSDIVAGALIGRRALVQAANQKLIHLGGSLDPHSCFLLNRGIKTLALRVKYQNKSALKIARFLKDHPKVKKVNYPGLEGVGGSPKAKCLFGGFGGMVSFELVGGVSAATDFISKLKIPDEASSLGGVESLVTRPCTTSHSGLSAEERESLGIRDGLIRLSVGVEGTEDLIEDLRQAF